MLPPVGGGGGGRGRGAMQSLAEGCLALDDMLNLYGTLGNRDIDGGLEGYLLRDL